MSDNFFRRLVHKFPGLMTDARSISPAGLIGYIQAELKKSPDVEKLQEIAEAQIPKKEEKPH